jgi:fumarate hydratase class I
MDKFMEPMLAHTGMLGSIGKSERGAAAVEAIRRHGGVHLIAVGGAAYLVAKAVRAARVLAFPELGMEAVREFEVKDMPVTVAVDGGGNAIHETGPREWRARIAKNVSID